MNHFLTQHGVFHPVTTDTFKLTITGSYKVKDQTTSIAPNTRELATHFRSVQICLYRI